MQIKECVIEKERNSKHHVPAHLSRRRRQPISKHALREAVRLAKVSHSVLRIVHVVDLVNIDVETSADQSVRPQNGEPTSS